MAQEVRSALLHERHLTTHDTVNGLDILVVGHHVVALVSGDQTERKPDVTRPTYDHDLHVATG